MFKPRRLLFITMRNPIINPIIIRLMRGFHRCHYLLPGAVADMAAVITVAGMAAGITD